MTQGLEATYSLDTRTCGHGQNFWQRLMAEGKQSSKVFRPLTHPGRESLCHMGRQHAHASTPKGFEPLRAEPNGFLVHLLSHPDTVSSAGDLHWLLKHSQSAFVHQPRRLMMSEVQPYCQFGSSGSHGFHCPRVEHIPAPHASAPKGFEPLRAEPNGFLVHLLRHSDTVSSAGDLHWLLRHSQSTFVHQPRRLMMSEVQP